MGILEKYTHSEEIKQLRENAAATYETAQQKMETQREKTSQSFEKLGKAKVSSWSKDIDEFLLAFNSFNTVDVVNIEGSAYEHITDADESQMIINMQQGTYTAKEIVKAGAASIGTGALVGIASYGGAMMFGHASTGTAIAALSGAAKTNATLAWFGGGAKAVGGLGKLGGTLVLAGIIVLPVLAVSTAISVFKGKEKLAEAKKLYAEACEAAEKMNVVTSGMKSMERMSDQYTSFIGKLSSKFKPYTIAVKKIRTAHKKKKGELIAFDELSPIEQRTLHVAWLLAQVYYQVLATPILTASGEVSPEATNILHESQEKLLAITEEAYRTDDERTMIADIADSLKAKRLLMISSIMALALIYLGVEYYPQNHVAGVVYWVGALIAGPMAFVIRGKNAKQCLTIRIALIISSALIAVFAYIKL